MHGQISADGGGHGLLHHGHVRSAGQQGRINDGALLTWVMPVGMQMTMEGLTSLRPVMALRTK